MGAIDCSMYGVPEAFTACQMTVNVGGEKKQLGEWGVYFTHK